MFVFFLLAAAAAIVIVMMLFLGWRHLDQRVQLAYSEDSVDDLKTLLEQALEDQDHLTSRVEHLEAIIASVPWETLQPESTPSPRALALPDEPTKTSSEDQVGRRQQSR